MQVFRHSPPPSRTDAPARTSSTHCFRFSASVVPDAAASHGRVLRYDAQMSLVGRVGVWAGLAVLGLASLGCSDSCSEVAALLRECCARGPAELRQSCEAEAKRLEDDGNSEACERALESGSFETCAR